MDRSPPSQQKIESALYAVSPEDRTVWFKMGAALKSELGDNGREMWEAWSQQSPAYNAQSARDVWKSMKPGKIEIASLFRAAQENGWQSPKETPTPTLSPEERRQRKEARELEAVNVAAEEKAKQAKAAKTAQQQIAQAGPASEDHPYLIDKHVGSHGIQQAGDKLLIPLRNAEGAITSLQRIDEEGKKRLLSNGVKQGSYHVLGNIEPGKPVGIAEGYATAATLHENLNIPVVVAVDANNLRPVATALKQQHPTAALQIFADDDLFIEREGIRTGKPKANAGIKSAIEAARATGANIVVPTFSDADVAKERTDFNDVQRRYGAGSVEAQYHSGNIRTADQVQAWQEARKANYRTQVAEASAQQEATPVNVSKTSVGAADVSAEVTKAEKLIDQSLTAKGDKVQQYRDQATEVAESLAAKTQENPFSSQTDARLHRSFENAQNSGAKTIAADHRRPPVVALDNASPASGVARGITLNDLHPTFAFDLPPVPAGATVREGTSPREAAVVNEIVNRSRAVKPAVEATSTSLPSSDPSAYTPTMAGLDLSESQEKKPSIFQRANAALGRLGAGLDRFLAGEKPAAAPPSNPPSETGVKEKLPVTDRIPDHLNQRYILDGDLQQSRYYFRAKPDEQAFRDRGDRLTTTSASEDIVKSMMVLAEAKRFTEIAIRGTQEFKRAAWMEASVRGIGVSGYEPTEQDQQLLNKRLNTVERVGEPSPVRSVKPLATEKETAPAATPAAGEKSRSPQPDDPQKEVSTPGATVANPEIFSVLSSAVKTLDRRDAIQQYPALQPVYSLVDAATQFVGKADISAHNRQRFIQGIEHKALTAIAKGEKVPVAVAPPQAQQGKTADIELSR